MQGERLRQETASSILPSLKSLLKDISGCVLPAILALEMFLRFLDEELSRQQLLVRIARRDPHVADMQFLNVTLSNAADGAIGAAMRIARKDDEQIVKDLTEKKAKAQQQDADADGSGRSDGLRNLGGVRRHILDVPHKEQTQRLEKARKHWVKGMSGYVRAVTSTLYC